MEHPLKMRKEIPVPREVAVCPTCQSELKIEAIERWVRVEGKMVPADANIFCASEPPADEEEWDAWFLGHYELPYLTWLPTLSTVQEWAAKNIFKPVENVK